jgi:hypothetical protein
MLKNNSTKESSVYGKLVSDCLLFKYARNRACRILGKAEWWERAGLLSERKPGLTLRKAGNFRYDRLMIFGRDSACFLQTLEANNGRYEAAPTAPCNIQCGRDKI